MPIAEAARLPRWDMAPIFPSLASTEFAAEQQVVAGLLKDLERALECETDLPGAISAYNEAAERLSTLRAYVFAHTTTDSRDELALARRSELDPLVSSLGKSYKRVVAWIGRSDVDRLIAENQVAKAHGFFLKRSKIAARHLMDGPIESLTSDLELTGSVAWQRLYADMTSQLEVELGGERLPMSGVRALAADPDRSIRRAAYHAELSAWKSVEVPIAASLNSIKGETLLLAGEREWAAPLDSTLFACNMDGETLQAMLAAARRAFPDFRRYLRLKAKALGVPALAWYDLFAPLPGKSHRWEYGEAERFIQHHFAAYSGRLGTFAARAMHDRWIDAEPRPGKVDGAYCSSLRNDESRVLLNYKPSFESVSTLAHELGHGYHNLCLFGRSPLQRATPMTLAETASIFCETIVRNAVLRTGNDDEKLEVLQASLQGSCQVVVDIFSRYLFEHFVFEHRKERELSCRELCDLMLDAQRETYGEGLDQELLHPYMWAAKSHYYGRSFYNFPYMFGLLFGLGLYSVYERQGEAFLATYDELLSSTGLADAATLAGRFGIDIRSEAFWESSLDRIRGDIRLFEDLI